MDSAWWMLVSLLLLSSVCATENEFLICNCEDAIGLLSMNNIRDCQRASDYLIAIAHFAIPIQLLYFVGCSILPSRWFIVELIAIIVLCGMTHFFNIWTSGPHRFHILFALTVFKMLTALVLCATALSTFTLIPWLIQAKIREYMLTKKVRCLAKEVEIIRRQNEARRHVHMLSHEIRKSLDKNTILYTTLAELSKSLALQNCAVWVPNEDRTMMILTHQLAGRAASIPYSHPEVGWLKETKQVIVLSADSAFGVASSGGLGDLGAVAAIRLPMLRVCYAILVLVASCGQDRKWDQIELEMIQAVVDQVAIAISHAAIVEESQITMNKLAEENRVMQVARENAEMAYRASHAFQMMMSDMTRKPMHTISGLLSLLPKDSLSSEQKLIVSTMEKTSNVLAMLANDVMDGLLMENGRFPSEPKSFGLHSLVREPGCLANCLCVYSGRGFTIEVDRCLPDNVVGDERSVFQVILHMVGSLLDSNSGGRGGSLRFHVFSQHGKELRGDQRWVTWASDSSDDGRIFVWFEVDLGQGESVYREADQGDFSSRVTQKFVEVNSKNSKSDDIPNGVIQIMLILLASLADDEREHLGVLQSARLSSKHGPSSRLSTESTINQNNPSGLGRGPRGPPGPAMNRVVTKQMLEKLGCCVTTVSSGKEYLSAIGPAGSTSNTQVVLFHDIDVFEVVARARTLYTPPLLVALTGFGEPYLKLEKVKKAGINALIWKPVVLEDLAAQLQSALLEANEGLLYL